MKNHEPEGFGNAKSSAEKYIKDKKKTQYLLKEAFEKAEKNRGSLTKTWAELMAILRLVRSWVSGEYTKAPWKTILFAIGGIIYFVNPFDITPDFIPGIGFLDDITIIGFVIQSIRNTVEDFMKWEQAKG